MRDEEFEKIMDAWVSEEIKSAPQMRPTAEIYRMVEAKKKRVIFPIYARWTLAGMAVASILLLLILHPAIFRPSVEEPSVGQRIGFVPEKRMTPKGTPGRRGPGPKKGMTTFRQLMFHYQNQDSQDVRAINLQTPQKERITLTSDDNYSILLQPTRDRYVYIYQLDSHGKLMKLFPNDTYSSVQNPLRQGETSRFPANPNWFYLIKSKGEERIYFIASAQPKQDWDELYIQYDKENSKKKKQEILTQLLKEITSVVEEANEKAVGWILAFN